MSEKDAAVSEAKFGTFKGVFTPSILTILGVIMYLRFGWVVGHAGLIGAILIVLLAHVVSFATGMSISSIATNRTVKAGGDYYMISRSLGLPIGGAIGLSLFVALALSTSLYLLGFAESFLSAFGYANTLMARRLVGSVACVVLTGITFFSTSLALKIQYLVLAAIGLSIISFFAGSMDTPPESTSRLWFGPQSESFATVFAVFFPAVTGFTAGVAMSGDLKDPRKSLPFGTMAAIFVGLAAYIAIPIFLTFKVDTHTLRTDQMVWLRVAALPQLIFAGVFAATLSSALGSVLGAPRYLQALAKDGVVPAFLGKGYGVLNEPRVGTVVTFLIAEMGILVGELDLIARIVTMFFLTSYGFLCLAAGIQNWSGIPSYRPEFKTPTWVSLAGALTCVGLMFKLDTVAMIVASVLMFAVYAGLKRKQFRAAPGDTWGGFWAAVVQAGVLHLHKRVADSRNWRPNVLVFGGPPAKRLHLPQLTRWLIQNRGLSTYFCIIEGDVIKSAAHARQIEPSIRDDIGRINPEMLSRVAVAPNIYEGIVDAAQSYGISGMLPNTVLMGWGEESEKPDEFTRLVRELSALDHNLLFLEYDEYRGFGSRSSIDIWWGGLDHNAELMILLAFLLKSSESWASARIRINTIVDSADKMPSTLTSLTEIIRASRVQATPNVIPRNHGGLSIAEMIAENSKETDLVLLGLRPPFPDENAEYVAHVSHLIEGLGTTLLVRASSHFQGSKILFEEE